LKRETSSNTAVLDDVFCVRGVRRSCAYSAVMARPKLPPSGPKLSTTIA
jgi:hypothetical protein